MTSVTPHACEALLPHVEQAVAAYVQDRTLDGHPRSSHRDRPDDHGPCPPVADTLRGILTYVTQHPSQAGQGQRFGMSHSHANTWIHGLHPVVNQALAAQERLPARTAAACAAMVETHATDGRSTPPCWHDGTERPIHRPTDPADQQDDYSGKQKGPTIKTRLVIDATCPIGCLSATSDGKAQETSLAEREGSTLPHGSGLDQAMGFQGVILNGITSVQPKKNPRGGHSPHRSK